MKAVFQTVVDKGKGNCEQANIASLFDLELSQVPNFILYPATKELHWWNVFYYFIYGLGYEVKGSGYPDAELKCYCKDLSDQPTVNGCIAASVKSRTFEGGSHAVIINTTGTVIHDPNPNQKFLGVNVIETKELSHWYLIEKIEVIQNENTR